MLIECNDIKQNNRRRKIKIENEGIHNIQENCAIIYSGLKLKKLFFKKETKHYVVFLFKMCF